MMRPRSRLGIALTALVLLTVVGCGAKYSNPPASFEDSELVGTWEARYGAWGVDRLIFREDGTFKQIYHDRSVKGYSFETPWNKWWVERFPDGRARVHLQGARFYAYGITTGEREGTDPFTWGELESFWDPIAHDFVTMAGELLLNVQSESTNGLVLLPMLLGSDEGWISFWTGRAWDAFHRVDSPSTKDVMPDEGSRLG